MRASSAGWVGVPLDTPSLTLEHADSRGELYSIALPDGRELMLLHSLKGSLRGGHSHSVPEQVLVLSGMLRYHKLNPSGQHRTETLGPGDVSYNPAQQIHLGEFLAESWIMEYKFARKGEWTQQNYAPWRERVDANAHAH